ncbi:MAG: glycosyl transferase group 1 family protein, partial [Paenibacillus sp.]|nr:glycosyl transferase group 1 family protein [Paenibacillus sp.]
MAIIKQLRNEGQTIMSLIIFPPTIDWSWMKQRPQQLMIQLARRGHHVFFCNKTVIHQDVQEIENNLFLVHDHQEWLSHSLPELRVIFDEKVGVWCTLSGHASTVSVYSPDWVVYDCVDDFAEWLRYEQEMVMISDLIVCTSQRLYERLSRTYPHKPIALIRNGYDEDMNLHLVESHSSTLEEEVLCSDKKWVGYIGAWAPWVDELLIKRLSLIPEVEVIVIGPEFGKKFESMGSCPNIHFLGLKPHHLLPGYISRLNICIIPFL